VIEKAELNNNNELRSGTPKGSTTRPLNSKGGHAKPISKLSTPQQ